MELHTPRLYLRKANPTDDVEIFAYRSDPKTFCYLSLMPQSVAEVREFIAATAQNCNTPGTWYQLAMVLKSEMRVIGDIGIHFLDNPLENKQVEIGYVLHPQYRRNGLAFEALVAVIDFVFISLEKHRIVASIDPENLASIKLIEKLGFRREGFFVESSWFHGQWVDDLRFAILAREWKEKK